MHKITAWVENVKWQVCSTSCIHAWRQTKRPFKVRTTKENSASHPQLSDVEGGMRVRRTHNISLKTHRALSKRAVIDCRSRNHCLMVWHQSSTSYGSLTNRLTKCSTILFCANASRSNHRFNETASGTQLRAGRHSTFLPVYSVQTPISSSVILCSDVAYTFDDNAFELGTKRMIVYTCTLTWRWCDNSLAVVHKDDHEARLVFNTRHGVSQAASQISLDVVGRKLQLKPSHNFLTGKQLRQWHMCAKRTTFTLWWKFCDAIAYANYAKRMYAKRTTFALWSIIVYRAKFVWDR